MNWKRIAAFCLSLLAVYVPQPSTQACGWSDEGEYYFKFFTPEIFSPPALIPFNYTFDRFYSTDWYEGGDQADNLADWRQYLRNFPSEQELREVIYGTSYAFLEDIEKYVQGKKKELGEAVIEQNALVRLWKQKSDLDVLTYLKYAKRCEHFVSTGWEETPVIPDDQAEQLTTEMAAEYGRVKSDFMKLRYAFQIVRLAHYAGQHKEALALYDTYVEPIQMKGLVKDWCIALKAGALRRTGREAEAAYLFSRVFDTCPSKRPQSFQSFVITTDENWEASLNLCKDNHEKSVLYAIRAIEPDANAMEDVRKVYALDPASPFMDLLLIREINKLENDLFGYQFAENQPIYSGYFGFEESDVKSRTEELGQFVHQVAAEKKAHSPELWAIASGYVDFMNGKYDNASQTLKAMFNQPGLDAEKTAGAKLLAFVVNCSRTENADMQSENALMAEYNQLAGELDEYQGKRAFEFMENVLTRLYRKQGQPAKYVLAGHLTEGMVGQPSHPLLIDMQEWVNKPTKSDYEKVLLARFNDYVGMDYVYELRGTLYLKKGQYDKAIAEFKKIPASGLPTLGPNPFDYKTVSPVNCEDWEGEYDGCQENVYTKLSLAQRMKALEDEAKANPDKAGMNYFLLGNAMYNMSYYGQGWRILDNNRSTYAWNEPEKEAPLYPASNWEGVEYTDLSLSRQYLEMALGKTGDRELKAKIIFSLAKIEQKDYYLSEDFEMYYMQTAFGYDKWFTKLKKEYSDTKYYREAIRECMYFDSFVKAR